MAGRLPEFVHPDISRDFVYIDDACEAFVDAALGLKEDCYGDSFNVGTGRKTTIGEVAAIGPVAVRRRGRAGVHHAQAEVGRCRLVRQHRQDRPDARLDAADRLPNRA